MTEDGSDDLLVFYDLEWSNNEIIQIGSVCGDERFSLCLRPSGRIDPFVRKKIKLDLREGPDGERQVFDMTRKTFLPTVRPDVGLDLFLTWIEKLATPDRKVILVSHGNADILVLDRNLSKFDMEERLYRLVSNFVDFQEYLARHFKDISSRMGLKHLLGIFCKGQTYRLHCADEDSAALQQIFLNLHTMRGVLKSNYLKNAANMRKVLLRSISLPKSCKEIKELAGRLNPGSQYVLLPNIFGVFNIFASSPLFTKIELPENFQFEVSGYVISHAKERYIVRQEYKERTKIELACYIGNAYFLLVHLINANVKSVLNLLLKIGDGESNRGSGRGGMKTVLQPGSPVSVTVLVTSTNYVKVVEIVEARDKKSVDVRKVLSDLHKLRPGERPGPDSEVNEVDKVEDHLDTNSNLTDGDRRPAKVGLLQSKEMIKRNEFREEETDSVTLTRRKKQLDYCKRTRDYQRYLERVSKSERTLDMPKTPNMTRKFSRRQWDGAVKRWKTQVHQEGRRNAQTLNENKSDNESVNGMGNSAQVVELTHSVGSMIM